MRRIIYRVEGQDGIGPYRRDWTVPFFEAIRAPYSNFPSPYEDGIHNLRDQDIFGFASMRKLRAWFYPAVSSVLANHGYKIGVYKVPIKAIKRGKKQVAFDALSGAVRVRVRELQ